MSTTLEQELLQAADRALQLCDQMHGREALKACPLMGICALTNEAADLRQRAAWAREQERFPPQPTDEFMKGWHELYRRLTGPIPSETAPAAPKEGTVKP